MIWSLIGYAARRWRYGRYATLVFAIEHAIEAIDVADANPADLWVSVADERRTRAAALLEQLIDGDDDGA